MNVSPSADSSEFPQFSHRKYIYENIWKWRCSCATYRLETGGNRDWDGTETVACIRFEIQEIEWKLNLKLGYKMN